jgi:gamma-glutamyl-gamma-aminobutyrate hydrolase PuuD
MPKVFIVYGGLAYDNMFEAKGWGVVDSVEEADLVQFTGGSDVSPYLYGEEVHPRTYPNAGRDVVEVEIYEECLRLGKPMSGICRGGQFLHVMNGGDLWQHIHGHGVHGTHKAWSYDKKTILDVTSTHHQAMRYSADVGEVLLWAAAHGEHEHMIGGEVVKVELDNSVESVYHEHGKCFCFQPHPEFNNGMGCREFYFRKIFELFGLGENVCAD